MENNDFRLLKGGASLILIADIRELVRVNLCRRGGCVVEWNWKPYIIEGKRRAGEILRAEIYKCAFCKGTGEKPRGTRCSVCRGKREVSVEPPTVICAYCKGGGEEHPRTNVTCTVCRGKGVVSIQEPIEICSHCRGTGAEPTNKLSCIVCKGEGVVTIKK